MAAPCAADGMDQEHDSPSPPPHTLPDGPNGPGGGGGPSAPDGSGGRSPGGGHGGPPAPPHADRVFDLWLQRSLHQLYDGVTSEPIPAELLRLIAEDRTRREG